ncbi:hypothetical protein [Flagellimonas sp. CMM7]|uniref:hypothetical protein n=1 Tax=Flagellimonas sp. CMM7 TaxID=2654676 RepID=UPI001F3B6D21|nr:hypothetical protein [Flagellimonas sp. CMM7]UII79005.1 hypothetical protein LV704_15245 [Flagellimonas sp. CMM7]
MNILLLAERKVFVLATESSMLEIDEASSVEGSETVDTIFVSIVLTSVFASTVEQNIDINTNNTA